MNPNDPDELTVLAGEYVLGVMAPADRVVLERELTRNRALVAAVAFWQDRLLEIVPVEPPAAPAAGLWARIERSLPQARRAGGLWNNLKFWRIGSMAAIAASVLLTLRLLGNAPQPLTPQYLAVLQAPAAGAHWLVEIDARAVHLRPLAPTAVMAGKSLQFWTKPVGAAGPTSLGLVPADRPTTIALNRLPALGVNQLFEVTLEPAGGSPLNRPTGPVLAVGRTVHL